MNRHTSRFAVVAALLALTCACSEKGAKPAPTPTPAVAPVQTPVAAISLDQLPAAWRADADGLPPHITKSLAFIHTMLEGHRATMDQVTCHCCGKTLTQCYSDTAIRAAKACSPL